MRSLTLWLFTVGCLLVAAQAFQLPNIEEPEEDILDELAEDEDVDVGRMLGDLFEDEEIDEDDDDDDEEVTGRQLATVTVSEQDRYNTFMDTLLSQLKRQARRDLEPMKLTLTKPKKKNGSGKKKQRKNKNKQIKNKSKKDKKNDKKEDKDEKKNNRNSKDVELPEIRDIDEDLHQIQRRQAETEEEVTGTKADEDDEEIVNEKRNKNRRNNSNNKDKNKNKNKYNNKKPKKQKQRKSNNKVVLHGLSHIAREGDVKLYEMNKGKVLSTDFVIGPVELDVTRKIDGEEHKAAATADTLKGKILIKINKKGNPRVKKLVLGRPKDIHTSGSIARGFGAGIGIFKKSVKQVAPTAAKKLLRAARSIIQTV